MRGGKDVWCNCGFLYSFCPCPGVSVSLNFCVLSVTYPSEGRFRSCASFATCFKLTESHLPKPKKQCVDVWYISPTL